MVSQAYGSIIPFLCHTYICYPPLLGNNLRKSLDEQQSKPYQAKPRPALYAWPHKPGTMAWPIKPDFTPDLINLAPWAGPYKPGPMAWL